MSIVSSFPSDLTARLLTSWFCSSKLPLVYYFLQYTMAYSLWGLTHAQLHEAMAPNDGLGSVLFTSCHVMILAPIEPDFSKTPGSCQAAVPSSISVELIVIKITFTFFFIIKATQNNWKKFRKCSQVPHWLKKKISNNLTIQRNLKLILWWLLSIANKMLTGPEQGL